MQSPRQGRGQAAEVRPDVLDDGEVQKLMFSSLALDAYRSACQVSGALPQWLRGGRLYRSGPGLWEVRSMMKHDVKAPAYTMHVRAREIARTREKN